VPSGDPPLTLRELDDIPLPRLRGVGDALAGRLADMGLDTVLDLLQHYPRRWIDRTKRVEIAALEVGEEATVIGEVQRVHGRRTRNGKALVEVVVHDGSSLLNVTFFNQGWREKQLAVGTEVSLFGKLDVYRGKRQMTMPVVDVLGRAGVADDKTGVILPVYPQSGKAEVFTWQLRALVAEALVKCEARGFADPVDEPLLDAHDLVERNVAMRAIHRPESMVEQRAAYRRLVFDEFLRMQVGLVARKRALAA
jgi:ATP-dependent DNA helicase RecG